MLNYKYTCNKLEFLTGQVEYLQSYEYLRSCLLTERLMKSSMLFECEPLSTSLPPDVIYVIIVPRPFSSNASSASVDYTECKPKNKKWWRPGNQTSISPHGTVIF